MNDGTATRIVVAALAAFTLTSCSGAPRPDSPPSTPTSSTAVAAPTSERPCNLKPTRDLIEWSRLRHPPNADGSTGEPASATEIGNVDYVNCKNTLDGWVADHTPSDADIVAGYRDCYEIAWADDNPGYDVYAVPAPRLKNVLLQAGNDC